MELPTIEMVGPPGPVVVNASDEAHYKSKGYRLKGESEGETPEGEPTGLPADEIGSVPPVPVPEVDLESDAMPPSTAVIAEPAD